MTIIEARVAFLALGVTPEAAVSSAETIANQIAPRYVIAGSIRGPANDGRSAAGDARDATIAEIGVLLTKLTTVKERVSATTAKSAAIRAEIEQLEATLGPIEEEWREAVRSVRDVEQQIDLARAALRGL